MGKPSKPHHVREEWQTVLRRALDLVGRDQLKLLYVFSDYVGCWATCSFGLSVTLWVGMTETDVQTFKGAPGEPVRLG